MEKVEIERKLNYFLQLRLQSKETSINHTMDMHLVAWDERSVTLAFPVKEWQLNPMGNMHGGMGATALDITMGCASYMFSVAKNVPTISRNIQYVYPILETKELFVKATIDHVGSRIVQVRCIGWQDQEERICITASGSYIVNI